MQESSPDRDYKKAAMNAPTPTTEPAIARMVAAAAELDGASLPVGDPLSSESVSVGLAPVPVGVAPLPLGELPTPWVLRMTAVLLFTETMMVWVELGPAVPTWGMV
jgi:hypothetical protein